MSDSGAGRLQLARELRRLRALSGLSTRAVAAGAGMSQSKVSRAENEGSNVKIEPSTVSALCSWYGVDPDVAAELCALAVADGDHGAWIVRAGGTARRQRAGASVEQVATTIRQWQPMLIPGIFQTPDYTRGLLSALGESTDPEVVIAARQQRQQLLDVAADGPRWDVILTEGALTARYATAAALASQIEHLASFGQHPRVSLRVIPAGAARTAMSMVPFMAFEFRGEAPTVVYVETPTVDLYVAASADVSRYAAMFDRLAADALSREQSLALMRRLDAEMGGERS